MHVTRLELFEVELGYQFDVLFIQINRSIRKKEYFEHIVDY